MSLSRTPSATPSLSVASASELQAISTASLVDGTIAYVQVDGTGIGSYWKLHKSSTTVLTSLQASGILYSAESTAGTNAGRWFRLGFNNLGGNTVFATQTADDATFWPVTTPASQLSAVITTSSTRLWVTFTASGLSITSMTAAQAYLYVNTVALTGTTFGNGGCGSTITFTAVDTFTMSFSRLLTGLTQGVNTIEVYTLGIGASGICNAATVATHHACLRVTEV